MSTSETATANCPDCSTRHRFLADELPDPCHCGHDWGYAEREREELRERITDVQRDSIKQLEEEGFVEGEAREENGEVLVSILKTGVNNQLCCHGEVDEEGLVNEEAVEEFIGAGIRTPSQSV